MKAERAESKQEFVPVIVTLESQEEVDVLFTLANHSGIVNTFPIMHKWYDVFFPFASNQQWRQHLWEKLHRKID